MLNYFVINVFCVTAYFVTNVKSYMDPYDNDLSIIHFIRNQGYPVEIYSNIRTEDGYLLDMQRVPYGKYEDNIKKSREPILLMPPLLTSGEIFVINNDSLIYLLSDSGYDVWIGNPRGSIYSRKHAYLDVNGNSSYWHYSWHEIGYYDLPVFIDYVINKTGYEKIILIGYSEGTTETFVMLSDRPEYNNKLKFAILLAPVAFIGHSTNLFLKFNAIFIESYRSIFKMFGMEGITIENDLLYELRILESKSINVKRLCLLVLLITINYDTTTHAVSPCLLLSASFHGVSIKEISHYAQIMNTGEFTHYDYGPESNKLRYGTEIAPKYNLNNVVVPLAIYYSPDDHLNKPIDMKKLFSKLNTIVYIKKLVNKFTHFDYITRNNIYELVYNDIINFIKNFK